MIRPLFLAASTIALFACSDDSAPAEVVDENLDARGQVLEGTISDDMLPLDTLSSDEPAGADGDEASEDETESES